MARNVEKIDTILESTPSSVTEYVAGLWFFGFSLTWHIRLYLIFIVGVWAMSMVRHELAIGNNPLQHQIINTASERALVSLIFVFLISLTQKSLG